MADEFKHLSAGTSLTQAEYEAVGGHVFACQATGDIVYASSGSQLSRLGKGAANTVLAMGGSCIPAWTASPSVTDLTIGGGCITLSAATDIDLLDNNASALSFDASGKTGIIDIVTTDCSEGVTMSGTLGVTGVVTASAEIELGHASDTTLARASSGEVNIEGNRIYRAGGTDVALADGGTGASLSDPGADRLLFWDDGSCAVAFLTAGSGLTICGTTMTASGGVAACANITWTGNQVFNHGAVNTGGSAFHRVQIDNGNAVTANTGTTGYVSTLLLCEPNVTESGGTVTTTSVIFIPAIASEGTNNYSINADAGLIRSGGGFMATGGSASTPTYTFCGDTDTGMWRPGGNNIRIATNSVDMMNIHEANSGFNIEFGDTGNSDGDHQMTLNNSNKNNAVFHLKNSDVAHGMTGVMETDSYAKFGLYCGNSGGLLIEGVTDGNSSTQNAIVMKGYALVSTDKDGNARGPITLQAAIRCGTSTTQTTNMNMVTVNRPDAGAALFVVDLEGDFYYLGSGSDYDEYCDVGLTRALSTTLSKSNGKCSQIIRSRWDDHVKENEEMLVQLGVLGNYVTGVPQCQAGLVNGPQLQRLHNGAIWQLHTRLSDQGEEIKELQGQLKALNGGK